MSSQLEERDATPVGDPGWSPTTDEGGRHETEAQRLDRNVAELLQELRIAGLGVQVLFGFLLSLPFTTRFVKLDDAQRDVYVATLLVAALSIALLAAPVAFHRLVFRRHEKSQLMDTANKMALAGLCSVGLAVTGAVLLVVSFVEHGFVVPLIAGLPAGVFVVLWFVVPVVHLRGASDRPEQRAGADRMERSLT
jgi:hypothetical protein